jgi:hypothetical protein
MLETIATGLVFLLGFYVAMGVVFALYFLVRGLRQIDPRAGGSTRGFRLIALPGLVALWPIVLRRFMSGSSVPPEEHNAHRDATLEKPGVIS